MALPKIDYPLFDVEIPSTKKKIKMRPMLVKDEKILLIAKEGNNINEVLQAIKQVVNNCIVQGDIDTNNLALFDVEYLFLRLRAISIGNEIKISYKENEIEHTFTVNLDDVKVKFPEDPSLLIEIGSNRLQMKYPVAAIYDSAIFGDEAATEQALFDELVVHCLDKYWINPDADSANVEDLSGYSHDQLKEFVDNLDIGTYQKIKEFISNMPTLYHEIRYGKNKDGTDKLLKLTSLTDFFTLL